MTALEALAEFASQPFSLDAGRANHVERMVIDNLCCAVAARETAFGRNALKIAQRRYGESSVGSTATVVGANSVTVESAAYLNTILSNALDYEAVGPEGHLIASVVPTVLAAAEAGDYSSEDALGAIAVGIEVGGRVGLSIRRPAFMANGGKTPDVQGMSSVAIGAAAGLARLWNFDRSSTAHALALAAYGAPAPLMRRAMEAPAVPSTKYDPLASHTRAAFDATELASMGALGDLGAVDGPYGLWRIFGNAGFDTEAALLDLGAHWYLDDEVWFKLYPVVLYINPIVEAMARLGGELGLAAEEIELVEIGHWNPKQGEIRRVASSESDAWLSIPVNAALGYSHARPRHSWRRPDVYGAEEVQTLASKTSVSIVAEERRRARGDGGPWNGWSPFSVALSAHGNTSRINGDGLRRYTEDELREKWAECLEPQFGNGAQKALTTMIDLLKSRPRSLMRFLGDERQGASK